MTDLVEQETASDASEGAAAATTESEPQRPRREAQRKRDSKEHGRRRRRAPGITCYVGPNGSGKSLAMIFDTLPTLDGQTWRCSNKSHLHMRADYVDAITGEVGAVTSGTRYVLSTVPIYDSETGELHRLYRPLSERHGGWAQVLYAEHCDILFDEITGIASSRDSMGMPRQVQTELDKLRKKDVLVRWTAPSWKRADSTIRAVTNMVTLCRGYFPDARLARRDDEPPAWIPNRLFKWRSFNAMDFEEFTLSKAAGDKKDQPKQFAMKPAVVAWFWGPGSKAFSTYDSGEAVSRIASYLDSGRCAICGGTVRVPICKGHEGAPFASIPLTERVPFDHFHDAQDPADLSGHSDSQLEGNVSAL